MRPESIPDQTRFCKPVFCRDGDKRNFLQAMKQATGAIIVLLLRQGLLIPLLFLKHAAFGFYGPAAAQRAADILAAAFAARRIQSLRGCSVMRPLRKQPVSCPKQHETQKSPCAFC